MGTLFLGSLYDFLFKNISHHGSLGFFVCFFWFSWFSRILGFLGFLGSCFSLGNIVFEVLVRFPFQKYITSWVFWFFLFFLFFLVFWVLVFHLGTLFSRSLYDFLFKNISHHGSFQGFPAPELYVDWIGLGMGWVGISVWGYCMSTALRC